MHILSSIYSLLNITATVTIYPLSLHDALPISPGRVRALRLLRLVTVPLFWGKEIWLVGERHGTAQDNGFHFFRYLRSEEHTSELQSRGHIVCRLLLEKKNRAALLIERHLTNK